MKKILNTIAFIKKNDSKKIINRIILELNWIVVSTLRPRYVTSAYGPKFSANFKDATFKFYIQGSYGDYLEKQLKAIDEPYLFLDIGANQGLYSLLAAKNPYCKKIWSFEPVKETFRLLTENIAINTNGKKITQINAAISSVPGTMKISINPLHTGAASLNHLLDKNLCENIDCVSSEYLDELIHPNTTDKIFIKIDTEGHEPVVINQLQKSKFWSRVNYIFFEIDENWFSGNELIQTLIADKFIEVYRTPNESAHYDVMMARK